MYGRTLKIVYNMAKNYIAPFLIRTALVKYLFFNMTWLQLDALFFVPPNINT